VELARQPGFVSTDRRHTLPRAGHWISVSLRKPILIACLTLLFLVSCQKAPAFQTSQATPSPQEEIPALPSTTPTAPPTTTTQPSPPPTTTPTAQPPTTTPVPVLVSTVDEIVGVWSLPGVDPDCRECDNFLVFLENGTYSSAHNLEGIKPETPSGEFFFEGTQLKLRETSGIVTYEIRKGVNSVGKPFLEFAVIDDPLDPIRLSILTGGRWRAIEP